MALAPRILETAQNKSVIVGTGSTKVLLFNVQRGYATIVNDSDEDIYLAFGADAALNSGVRLNAMGGAIEIGGGGDNYFGEVSAICTTGGKRVVVMELNTK